MMTTEAIPGWHEVEDTAKRWYDSDILILVRHDDLEAILTKIENEENIYPAEDVTALSLNRRW